MKKKGAEGGRTKKAAIYVPMVISVWLTLVIAPAFVLVDQIVAPLFGYVATRHWEPTQAYVKSAQLEKSRSPSIDSIRMGGGWVYRVKVVYEYRIEGQRYEGGRVGLIDVTDSDPQWHNRWYEHFRAAQRHHQPITVYVNPAAPQQTIVDRNIRGDRIWVALIIFLVWALPGTLIALLVTKAYRLRSLFTEPQTEGPKGAGSAPEHGVALRGDTHAPDSRGGQVIGKSALGGDPVFPRVDWEPVKQGGTSFQTRRLDRDPDRICVKVTPAGHILAGIFLFIGLVQAMGGVSGLLDGEWFPGTVLTALGGFFLLTGLMVAYQFGSGLMTFDKRAGLYFNAKHPGSGLFGPRRARSGSLSQIHAFQIVAERLKGKRTGSVSYELNLIFRDGERVNVMDHGNETEIAMAAQTLGEFIGVPVWVAP